MAAGCTPDANEANYEDYSTSFWSAIRGKTRTGVTVEKSKCDFDGDGAISFVEAHAYVLLHDNSIDVPTTTSDRFLRLRSDPGASRGRLVSAEDMLARLQALASPADHAVVEGLSRELELSGQYRYAGAKELAESLHARHRGGQDEQRKLRRQLDQSRREIRDALELRWPELRNRWDPAVAKLLRDDSAEVVSAIKAHKRYAQFSKGYDDLKERAKRDEESEVKWSKAVRLMRTLERVALAYNIEKVADADTLVQYKALAAAENGTLGAGKSR
jgi:hypothetical protein